MSKTKINIKNISIKMVIIIAFLILILTTVTLIGYIVFSNWISSTDESITKITNEINSEIYEKIDKFMDVPEHIIDVNEEIIEKGIVDIKSQIQRERFFVGVLRSQNEDVYSFGYGTETGEYYGARRNQYNNLEIMKNNIETQGHSWYYSVNENMTAGELIVKAGKFDPRTREWYNMAKTAQKSVFSPIYKHFFMNDLTVSEAIPIYNELEVLQGVLASHITLSRIDSYLKEVVKDKNALSIIIEEDTGKLIADSLNTVKFTSLGDGTIERLTLKEVNNQAVTKAYEDYKNTGNSNFKINYKDDKLHINLTKYHKYGLNWLVITAVPSSLFTTSIVDNIKFTVFLTLIIVSLSIFIYLRLTRKFLKPIDSLIDTTEKFSKGDLSQRAIIFRDDEIGKITKSFNKMADTIYMLVNNLEGKVKERTTELEVTNTELRKNKDQLQLILDSTVEGIYGVDNVGKCTFCNAKGLKLLGYANQEDLLGKDIHSQIHHTYKDGNTMLLEECKIYKGLLVGKGTHVDDEVFWRADGTSFDVEYYSYPQYKDEKIIGAVVTFMDNSERKRNEERIKYLSYHDSLTGLYNRMFFEDELRSLDTEKNLPISIIFGDVNGLKLTNDIFGHGKGDELLKISAEILKKVCSEEGIVARVGGDEFAIILTNTKASDANKVINRIKAEFSKEKIIAIKGNISMGYHTKINLDQDINRIVENAEDGMYKEKMLNRKTINSDMVSTIIETLHSKSPREKRHSINVSNLCGKIGEAMKMTETKVRKLKDAGFLHDIGKIALDEDILSKSGHLTEEENKQFEQHSVVGFRILNLFDETLELAECILNHHENWDGSGYPKGLKGEEIPLLARIIKVAEGYDAKTNNLSNDVMNKEEALNEIKRQSGIIYDPEIADIFIEMMSEKE